MAACSLHTETLQGALVAKPWQGTDKDQFGGSQGHSTEEDKEGGLERCEDLGRKTALLLQVLSIKHHVPEGVSLRGKGVKLDLCPRL